MKKILLAGALAASMLASSAAFAADLTVGVSEDKLYVTVDTDAAMTANAGKQMTVVVVDGDGTTVTTDTIRYIDQDAAAADLFESMGVLLREGETELPVGTYTVKIGGEGITDLYVGTFSVAEEAQGTKVVFANFGNVNAEEGVNLNDAFDIMAYYVGGEADLGAEYAIGTELTLIDESTYVFGDVNAETGVNLNDAFDIMAYYVGGEADLGGLAAIGAENVEITLK